MKPNGEKHPQEIWIPLTEAGETMEIVAASGSERHTIAARILARNPRCGRLLRYIRAFAAKYLRVQVLVRVDRPDWWPPARARRPSPRPRWGWAAQLRAEVDRESPELRTVTLTQREIAALLPAVVEIARRGPDTSVRQGAWSAAIALLAALPAELREVCEQEVLAATAPPEPVRGAN